MGGTTIRRGHESMSRRNQDWGEPWGGGTVVRGDHEWDGPRPARPGVGGAGEGGAYEAAGPGVGGARSQRPVRDTRQRGREEQEQEPPGGVPGAAAPCAAATTVAGRGPQLCLPFGVRGSGLCRASAIPQQVVTGQGRGLRPSPKGEGEGEGEAEQERRHTPLRRPSHGARGEPANGRGTAATGARGTCRCTRPPW